VLEEALEDIESRFYEVQTDCSDRNAALQRELD
jgi:hypothetical protein